MRCVPSVVTINKFTVHTVLGSSLYYYHLLYSMCPEPPSCGPVRGDEGDAL